MRESKAKILWVSVILAVLSLGVSLGASHTVWKSETFYSIARKHHVSVKSLMAINGAKDPRFLRIGQRLKIPGKVSTHKKKNWNVAAKVSSRSRALQIVLDPGHGGRDRGAVWGGVRESNLNMKVSRKAASYLRARGYRVTMTRRSDVFISLSRRAAIANRLSNAIFISVHFNACHQTYVHGAETFYDGRRSRYLASSIQRELVRKLKVHDRGVRYRRFAVLRNTNCPAVLVECGFISNSRERARCNTSSYQTAAAKAIVAGIERYDRAY